LNPKKYKEILDITNSDLNLDGKVVKKVVDYYWETVRKNLTSLDSPYILIDGFGTFNIKWNILQINLRRYTEYLANRENLIFSRYHVYKSTEEKLEKMRKVEEQMKQDYEKKKEHRKRKNEGNMGE
jgi:hypothetical protein